MVWYGTVQMCIYLFIYLYIYLVLDGRELQFIQNTNFPKRLEPLLIFVKNLNVNDLKL